MGPTGQGIIKLCEFTIKSVLGVEMELFGTVKARIPPVKGVDILGIATFALVLLNLGFLLIGIRILGNLITHLFEKLDHDLGNAIKTLIDEAKSIDLPDVNPLQVMVMEMIKNNMSKNNEDTAPPIEIKRNLDGTFTQDTSL